MRIRSSASMTAFCVFAHHGVPLFGLCCRLRICLLRVWNSISTAGGNITQLWGLLPQGIGNAVSGLFGGVPGAGATMRTVVNVRAGGRTPLSGAFHSLILLCVCLGLGRFAERVPLAVLGGILMKCGFDVIDFAYLRRLKQLPLSSIAVMVRLFAAGFDCNSLMPNGEGAGRVWIGDGLRKSLFAPQPAA